MENSEGVASDAYKAGQLATGRVFELADGRRIAVVPAETKTIDLPPLHPAVIVQKVVLHDADSFVSYVNRYKHDGTRMFAVPGFLTSADSGSITAVFDYHTPDSPKSWRHTAVYAPRYSEQWDRWSKLDGALLKQAAFAELIEETRADIREPTAAQLMDVVRTFKANKKIDFDSVVYQPNGDVTLGYSEKTEQTGASGRLPEQMTLGIPVYFRGTVYAVPVLVRYRVESGAVNFSLKRDRPDRIEDDAFQELLTTIAEKVGIEAYQGNVA